MLVYCWASVEDAGPTISQHWFIVSCLLGRIKLTSKSYREWYYWQCAQPYTQTLLKVVTELFVMYKRRRPYSRIFCCDDITLYIIRYTLYLFRWCLFITLSFLHCTYFTTITQIIIIHHKILIFLHMTVCILPNTVNWIEQIWILATLTFLSYKTISIIANNMFIQNKFNLIIHISLKRHSYMHEHNSSLEICLITKQKNGPNC